MVKIKGDLILQHALKEIKKKIKSEKPKVNKLLQDVQVNESKHSLVSGKTERGLIYLGHIPHGFYEEQIKKFFKQFGTVINVRVMRSQRTGRSKGYGFVLFDNVAVAKVAAEAMNNYLMAGRLLKVHYVPKEKQNLAVFYGQNYHKKNYPKLHNLKKTLSLNRGVVTKEDVQRKNQKTLNKLKDLEESLKSKGINLSLVTKKKSVKSTTSKVKLENKS